MEMVDTLYGSKVDKCRACGYCRRKGKYLTVNQVRKKECLKKQCRHLNKLEDHPWWTQRTVAKARKKANRAKQYGYDIAS